MQNLILIGMMGSGKTSVGKVLSAKLAYKHVDTDDLVVSMNGFSISDIFKTAGEAKFRELEAAVLDKLSCLEHVVISTGGGIVLNPVNAMKLKNMGTVIYLKASSDQLEKNLENEKLTRPLLATQSIASILMVRNSLYEQLADFVVETDGKSIDEIATLILLEHEK